MVMSAVKTGGDMYISGFKGAADIFLEMVTQPFPGFDGIVQDSSNQATV